MSVVQVPAPVRSIVQAVAKRLLVRCGVTREPRPSGLVASARPPEAITSPPLVGLVYELLDAHDDTARLASDFACDPEWTTHLAYLRALQRTGREVLAHTSLEQRR